jgi:superfamily II DNA or RNA helicase
MARHSPLDPEIRSVVERLAQLYLVEASVSGLQRLLESALARGDRQDGRVYPNRLHALLSEDPGRAVNSLTLSTVQRALAALDGQDADLLAKASREARTTLLTTLEKLRRQSGNAVVPLRQLAESAGLPPAVVRLLLDGEDASITGMQSSGPVVQSEDSVPDWSFQDRAYDVCVTALRKDPNRKVGLVLPTGGGKTRVAVRVLLRILADDPRPDAVVLWVTHRTRLGRQARRELQRAITAGVRDLPDQAVQLLGTRVMVTMVAKLRETLDEYGDRVALVVVDEAHHAAAASYQTLFERRPLRGLFLTATPVRTDFLPIGIDEIAYTTTYRDLFERGVIIEPSIEPPLTIDGFDWNDPAHVRDLADYVVARAENEFVKTLVVTARIEHVELVHEAIVNLLEEREDHVLAPDDILYAHGSGSSTGEPVDEALDEFSALPRGILVATAQLLAEGFDDPSINTVVVTYPTSSVIQLMQAAGRCLRSAPGKSRAFIVQVRGSSLGYHYEQRWLYQDISDFLHPQLTDRTYESREDLEGQVEALLGAHRVDPETVQAISTQMSGLAPGDRFSLLLTGLPYFGPRADFETRAPWSAVLVTPQNRDLFLRVFNDFCARGASVAQLADYLRNFLAVDPSLSSTWTLFMHMLLAMDYARQELGGIQYAGFDRRGYAPSTGTTWLRYITFTQGSTIPAGFEEFLGNAVNREEIVARYVEAPNSWAAAVKVDLPLAGTWAYLLDPPSIKWLDQQRQDVRAAMYSVAPLTTFGVLASWRLGSGVSPLPQVLMDKFGTFVSDIGFSTHVHRLKDTPAEDAGA